MTKEWMPKGGAKELRQTKSGREYLGRLQRRHEIDLLQPGNPKFDKVYGNKRRKEAAIRDKQERQAKDEWGALEEKNNWRKKFY